MDSNVLCRRIGYNFSNPDLLDQALTHRSHSHPHNERLEFLGDSVLNCAVAGLVFRHFNIDFEHQVVPLYTNEFEQFRKQYFPARQLPALITDEDGDRQVIWDSLSIVEFLSDHHPKLGIWPSDPGMRAAARSLCAEMHSAFKTLRPLAMGKGTVCV